MTALLLIFALVGLGSVLLAIGMDRHHRTLFGRLPTANAKCSLKWGGAIALLAGLVCAIAIEGAGVGTVEWMILLGLAATVVGVALPGLKKDRS